MMAPQLAAMFGQAAFMIALPIFLWIWFGRRLGLGRRGWAIIGYGCLFFLLSQVVNTPLRLAAHGLGATEGMVQVVAFSLIAGLGEETLRYVAMRYVGQIREGLDRASAVAYGLGHGGFESLLLGLSVLATAFILRGTGALESIDVTTIPTGLAAQAAAVAATPPYVFAFGALERVLAIGLHVGLSMVVASAVLARQPRLLVLAILWHTAANGVALTLQSAFGSIVVTELWLVVVAAAAIAYGAARVSSAAGRPVPPGGIDGGLIESPASGRS